MEPRHLDEVMVIEEYSFPTPWERNMYELDITSNPHARFYVALAALNPSCNDAASITGSAASRLSTGGVEEIAVVAGYIGNWFIIDECHVGTIAVNRAHRRLGIAKLLLGYTALNALEEGLSHIILEVRTGNEAAIDLYLNMGFKIVGRRKGYYQDTGEDAHLMMATNLDYIARLYTAERAEADLPHPKTQQI